MKLSNKIISLLLSIVFPFLLTAGCASNPVPFNEGKALEINGTFWNRSFKQDGKDLRYDIVFESLKKFDASEDSAHAAEFWWYSALASGSIGGAFIGYYLFDNFDSSGTRGTGIAIGAAFVGFGILSAYFSDKNLVQGAKAYNGELKYHHSQRSNPESGFQVVFGVSPSDKSGSLTPLAGFKYTGF